MRFPTISHILLFLPLLISVYSSRFPRPNRKDFGFTYHSYQKGITCTSLFGPVYPSSLQEIKDIVHFAKTSNVTLKPLGNLFSVSDMICTEGIPIGMEKINHFYYNPLTGLATIGAGATLDQLITQLNAFGRSLLGIPGYSDITIGGALGTSSHGSSLVFPSTLSDQMKAITVVDGLGNLQNISDPYHLSAFKTHLGLLGVIYDVTFQTVPQYKVQMVQYPVPDEHLDNTKSLLEVAKSNAFFQFWWFPTSKEVIISRGNMLSMNADGDCESNLIPEFPLVTSGQLRDSIELMQVDLNDVGMFLMQSYTMKSLFQSVLGKNPVYSTSLKIFPCPEPATGFSYKMLTNKCTSCPWHHGDSSLNVDVGEVIIPVEELEKAIKTMREIFQEYPTEFPAGIHFRFMTKSSGLLSPNRDQESVSIEWELPARVNRFQDPKLGLPAVQALTHALVAHHKGRTHWGKNGLVFSSPEMISFQHSSSHRSFISVMSELDPLGIFLNDFGRRIRFAHHRTSSPAPPHCALVDHCICQTNSDCGSDNTLTSSICGSLHSFSVCLDDPNIFAKGKRSLSRHIIGKLQSAQSSWLTTSAKIFSPFLWG